MKVLLRDDVDGVGRRGDIVKVAGGFARNFLLPEGRAILASPGVEGQAAQMRKGRDLREAKRPGRRRGPGDDPGGGGHPALGPGRRRRTALRLGRSGRRGQGHPCRQGCGNRQQTRAAGGAHQGGGLLRHHGGALPGRGDSGDSGGHGRFLRSREGRRRGRATRGSAMSHPASDHCGMQMESHGPPQVSGGCPQPHPLFGGSNPQLVALVTHSSLSAELGDRGPSL